MEFHSIAEREVDSVVHDLVRKLKAAAEAELGDVRRNLEADLETIRTRADALREELETESARAATLEADLDAVIEAHRNVDAERVKAEAALADEVRARTAAEEELKAVRERLDTARAELAQLHESVESETASRALLEADLASTREARAAAQLEVQSLQASLHALQATVSQLEADLRETRATAEAQLHQEQAARGEAEARFERERYARGEIEGELRQAREAMETRIREMNERLAQQVEAARAEAGTQLRELERRNADELRAVRDVADAQMRDAQEAADALVAEAGERAAAEIRSLREGAEVQVREAREAARLADSRTEELTSRLQTAGDELASAQEQLRALESRMEDRAAELLQRDEAILSLETRLAETLETETALRRSADEAREVSLRLREDVQGGAARYADAVARAEAAEAAVRLAEDELSLLRGRPEAADAMLQASVRALESLAASTSIAALMAGLARQLAPHFDRVAIFRLKGHHLEGEGGAGLDPGTDVTRLSVPIGVASPITRAATTRTIQELDLLALAEDPAPLGGSPSAALAIPVIFQGDTFAVAYVDRSDALEPAHRSFAALLAAQTSVLLGRLSQELKVMKELREYAALLVQEAEQMFVADLESGRSEEDRRRRLAETIECARQLFAQRASLEGAAAARALDEYLSEVLAARGDSPFVADLTTVLADEDGDVRKTG